MAEENSDDPFLIALAERAKLVQESFEDHQTSTAEALATLLKEIEKNEQRKKEQAAKGLDGLTYFVLCKLTDDGIPDPEAVSKKIQGAFARLSKLAAERGRTSRTSEKGYLCDLCRGGRSAEGYLYGGRPLYAPP